LKEGLRDEGKRWVQIHRIIRCKLDAKTQ